MWLARYIEKIIEMMRVPLLLMVRIGRATPHPLTSFLHVHRSSSIVMLRWETSLVPSLLLFYEKVRMDEILHRSLTFLILILEASAALERR